ncbi:Single-stranded DNA-binding protein [hydrothermal vent metagenome]|uniref:Single-stranded DNA-binding protein n=1 Tax=hydrothermal vent metagenome TaxID=652676 RepID=A0A3B1BH45_9ZZZZ
MKKYITIFALTITSLVWVQSCRTIDSKSVGDFVESVSRNVNDVIDDVQGRGEQSRRAKTALNNQNNPNNQNNQNNPNYQNNQNNPNYQNNQNNPNYQNNQAPNQNANDSGLIGIAEKFGIDRQTVKIAKTAVGLAQALQPIGLNEELTIGGSLALEVVYKFGGMYKNPVLQNYVNLVGKSLAEVSDRPDIEYHFAVLNTDHPNGFATPGGYIFVSVGLLRILTSEAQLAGVLGHEIAHITEKHALKTLRRGKILSGMSSLTMAAMNKDEGMFNKVVLAASNTLFTHGLDKDLEFEADKLGMEYAYRMGYQPTGLQEFIEILSKSDSGETSIYFSTHPSFADRLLGLSKLLPQYQGVGNYPVLATRYQSKIKGQLPKALRKQPKVIGQM